MGTPTPHRYPVKPPQATPAQTEALRRIMAARPDPTAHSGYEVGSGGPIGAATHVGGPGLNAIFQPVPGEKTDAVHKPAHYSDYAIEPVNFILANKVEFCEANAIKYVMRHRKKNGAEDIRKAIRYLEILLEFEYGAKK